MYRTTVQGKTRDDPQDCGKNRSLSVLLVVVKMYANALIYRVIKFTEGGIGEEQRDSRKDRSCTD